MANGAARNCVSWPCAAASSPRTRVMAPSTVSPLRSDGSGLGTVLSRVLGGKDPI